MSIESCPSRVVHRGFFSESCPSTAVHRELFIEICQFQSHLSRVIYRKSSIESHLLRVIYRESSIESHLSRVIYRESYIESRPKRQDLGLEMTVSGPKGCLPLIALSKSNQALRIHGAVLAFRLAIALRVKYRGESLFDTSSIRKTTAWSGRLYLGRSQQVWKAVLLTCTGFSVKSSQARCTMTKIEF